MTARRIRISPTLCCGLLATVAIAGFELSRTNTLENSGRWAAFKAMVEMVPMGTSAFMGWTQALAGGQLHLDAWHGYQEVLTTGKHLPGEIQCDFRVGHRGYVVILLGRDLQIFRGFRLSAYAPLPNAALVGPATGEFATNDTLKLPPLEPGVWHHARVQVEDDTATLYVNGEEAGSMLIPGTRPRHIGFRGGAAPASIDNVLIHDADGMLVAEDDFMNWERFPLALARAATLLIALSFLGMSIARRRGIAPDRAIAGLTAVLLCAATAFFMLWMAHYLVLAGRYPTKEELEEAATEALERKRERVHGIVERQALEAVADGDARRILFVGSSQTFGDGALREDQTFVSILTRKMAKLATDESPFKVFNMAVQADTSTGQLQAYEGRLSEVNPELVVINLSCNDRADPNFEDNLRRFATYNRDAGIRTIFVREAMSSERHDDPAMVTHAIMSRVGEVFDIPVVQAHTYLAERLNTGFLWWDIVHPTSYGHSLIAEAIWPTLRDALGLSEKRIRPTKIPAQ